MKMTPSVFAVDLAIPATYLLGLCLQMLPKTRDAYDLKRGAASTPSVSISGGDS